MQRATTTAAQRTARSGFTLLELLIVISIIAILMAILIPAITGVRRRVQVQQVSAEFTQIDSAIAKFQADFSISPYSELIVIENPTPALNWDSPALAPTKTKLRRIWPQFNFSGQIDFNADGAFSSSAMTISGSEALIFFLAGVMTRDQNGNGTVDPAETGNPPTWVGFSKNPVTPLLSSGSNRVGPYFTFDAGRFRDTDNDGMREYVDPLPGQETPIMFVSSNNGQGYAPAVNFYVQADGRTPWNKDSHQLVSPGLDGVLFDNPQTPATPIRSSYSTESDLRLKRNYEDAANATNYEMDNIANFKPGSTLEN